MPETHANPDIRRMHALLHAQKQACLTHGPLTLAERTDWLNRLIGLLVDNKDEIADTISSDFGNRTRELSLIADVLASINALKFARDNLASWMAPEEHEGMFPDAQARVEYTPLGVVGMLSPWNFPFNLTFGPLAGIVSAGNRCIIKPSELSPATSALLDRLLRSAFHETEIAVVLGGPDVAAEFSKLDFDHILYTGSTAVASHVMRAAADHLVPVTLELGGKSPVIISKTAPIDDAAARVMTIKTLNAGQICLAPDYVLLQENQVEPFIAGATKAVAAMFPTLLNNPDYTAIINERHHTRLQSYLDDAKAGGARIIELNPANESFAEQNVHRMPPTLVIKPSTDSRIMKEEIFGPLLPVLTYTNIEEAIDFVNQRDRPLALYYFGRDAEEEQKVITNTVSGGVTVNDCMTHAFAETMPFGGVGPSGTGAYHGISGFKNFSHARAIYRQGAAPEAEYAVRAPIRRYDAPISGQRHHSINPLSALKTVLAIPLPAAQPAKRKRGRPSHLVPSELFETRREEILRGARVVFMQKTYAAASLDDVAREIGLSKPTLYYYFASKAHLFFELASLRADEEIAKLAVIAEEPDPLQCLILLMRHQVQQVTAEMDFYRYFFDHQPELDDPELKLRLSRKLGAYSSYFYKGIRRAIDAGILPPIDEFVATQAIFGSTFWIYKWFDAKKFNADDVLTQFLQMIGIKLR